MQLLETSETGFVDTRFSVTGFSVDVLKAKGECQHDTGFSETGFSNTSLSDTGFFRNTVAGSSVTGSSVDVLKAKGECQQNTGFQNLVFQKQVF